MRRGLPAVRVEEPGCDKDEDAAPMVLSPSLPAVATAPFAARKVLLTDTDLNDVGFFTADTVREWPLRSPSFFVESPLDASVSEPPLTLTSVEFTSSSTMSVMCLFSNSSAGEPFRRGLPSAS